MKKVFKILVVSAFLLAGPIFLSAQPQPSDPNFGGGTTGGGPIGGAAPIGGGLIIMLTLGAAYGAKKVYNIRKKSLLD
jgi:hypothetical protein